MLQLSSDATTSLPSQHIPLFVCNDTATTEIYTLSLHDALPIYIARRGKPSTPRKATRTPSSTRSGWTRCKPPTPMRCRSEEHTSELQSLTNLVCRLLLEKKNAAPTYPTPRAPGHQSRSTTATHR